MVYITITDIYLQNNGYIFTELSKNYYKIKFFKLTELSKGFYKVSKIFTKLSIHFNEAIDTLYIYKYS